MSGTVLHAAYGFLIVLALGPLSSAADTAQEIFDQFLTQQFIASACNPPDFSFHADTSGVTRSYANIYRPRSYALAPDEYYVLSVSIAPAGTFLTAAQYQERYDEFRRQFSDRGPEFFRREFPPIGSRALLQFFGFGPGGSSFGITFTTRDELFDIRVAVGMSPLPNDVPIPDCDIEALAHRIEASYQGRK